MPQILDCGFERHEKLAGVLKGCLGGAGASGDVGRVRTGGGNVDSVHGGFDGVEVGLDERNVGSALVGFGECLGGNRVEFGVAEIGAVDALDGEPLFCGHVYDELICLAVAPNDKRASVRGPQQGHVRGAGVGFAVLQIVGVGYGLRHGSVAGRDGGSFGGGCGGGCYGGVHVCTFAGGHVLDAGCREF